VAAVRCARLLLYDVYIDMVQRVNGANKANKAYAECFKIRKCGCYRFRKA